MLMVVPAVTPEQIGQVSVLFREYGKIPGIEVCLDTFDGEVADLPGIYEAPSGRLILATLDGEPAGCVGICKLEEGVCEMRRLYVREKFRGVKAGKALADAALESAAGMGYRKMRLETLPELMTPAVSLYRALGFQEIPPYADPPKPGALHMERALP